MADPTSRPGTAESILRAARTKADYGDDFDRLTEVVLDELRTLFAMETFGRDIGDPDMAHLIVASVMIADGIDETFTSRLKHPEASWGLDFSPEDEFAIAEAKKRVLRVGPTK
jgi:hypothetical protein